VSSSTDQPPVALAIAGVAYAEANWGRWIARCPRPWCTNALALEAGQLEFACLGLGGCGATAEVVWPPDPQAIAALLAMRPVQGTQNWLPGETLEDLLAENAAHDLIPAEWLALAASSPGGIVELLGTTDGVVTSGLLLDALDASSRPAIGA